MGPWEDFAPAKAGPWEDFAQAPARGIGQPEELTFGEKAVGMLPQALQDALSSVAGGNLRGSAVGRVAMGAADPGVAIAQLAANAVGAGDSVNRGISETEAKYQAARKEAGSEGFDVGRLAGNVAMTLPVGLAGAPATTIAGMATKGALQGAAGGALAPVTDAQGLMDFLEKKAAQASMGAAGGAAMAPVAGVLGRLVSPKASVNPELAMLRQEGIDPTIGQALGGMANRIEQKAASLPIVGDRIGAMRRAAVEQFNEAAINRATAPVGKSVQGSGQDAIAKAGDILSDAYEAAIGKVKGVVFDTPEFNADLAKLQQLTSALEPAHKARFDKALNDVVVGRMSPNGGMIGQTFKRVDSELGQLASRYGKSPMAGEQELAAAVKELQTALREQVARSEPAFAEALRAADKGWANLVRVEGAGARAINTDGVFTPGQLGMASRTADRSVRHRASARGDALMQDLSTAGQNVLGNTIPNSGTVDRAGVAALGALLGGTPFAPGITVPAMAAMGAGTLAYTGPVQRALVAAVSRRPDIAPEVANRLRLYLAGPLGMAGGFAGAE